MVKLGAGLGTGVGEVGIADELEGDKIEDDELKDEAVIEDAVGAETLCTKLQNPFADWSNASLIKQGTRPKQIAVFTTVAAKASSGPSSSAVPVSSARTPSKTKSRS